ncbi:MAG: hypothetical protein ACI81L_002533 [Verrucomicrobiales bacterium]
MSTLTRFAESHGITYPLLSDEGSAVITELGILNVTLDEERAAYDRKVEERHRGIPYPGSFVLDEDGILVGKRLEQSHRVRPTANTLMTTFFGPEGGEPAGMVSANSPGVRVAVWLDTQVVSANQQQDAHVRFVLEPDVHLYTEPVPAGFRAVSVKLTGDDAIHVEDVEPLEGHEFSIAGLDESFYVLENTIDIAVPFFLLTNRDTAGEGTRKVPMSVEIAYQACTGDECFMPETVTLELELNEEPNPGYETKDLAALAPLVMRRIVEAPKTEAELLDLVNAALVGVGVDAGEVRDTIDVLVGRGLVFQAADGRWVEAKGEKA